MKVLLLNGSPHKEGCTHTALAEVAAALEGEGVETELFWLGQGGCTEIAYRCGFSNSAQFSAIFKREKGLSPQQYRKTARGG